MRLYINLLSFLLLSFWGSAQKKIQINFALQDEASLTTYLSSKKIDFSDADLYILKDFKSFAYFNNNDKLQVPEILFFNSEGYLVKNRFNNNECTEVISDIETVNRYKSDKKITLQDWLQFINPLKNPQPAIDHNKITVVINWAIFTDQYNEQSFEWYKRIRSLSLSTKINCILLNLDVQQKWDLTEKQKAALHIE
ncbi:hypothetical protein [uncultured Chryseobacterium sp.]|uniref:hypothetical protein n=1 Tax=uncultured Chryseobacterium sp. TaxID=259322 RepID=UPI0025F29789|nr:hypothetical protein [uncultured Chryseobacterium sp.]